MKRTKSRSNKRAQQHPLLWCMANKVESYNTQADIAEALGVSKQALYQFVTKAVNNPKATPVPPHWVRPLGRFFGVSPHFLRPDLFAEHWTERRELI